MAIREQLLAAILCVAAAPAWCAARQEPNNRPMDDGLRQAYTRAMYSLEHFGHGTYRGQNEAQQLSLEFDHSEVRLNHPEGSLHFHLTGYGYDDRLQKPARATLSANGDRLEYRRGELTEWYVNGSEGLEQGFTLAHRPGTLGRDGKPLVIAIGMSGRLNPGPAGERRIGAVRFDPRCRVALCRPESLGRSRSQSHVAA